MPKRALRSHYRKVGRDLARANVDLASAQTELNKHLCAWLLPQTQIAGASWMGFQPLPGEPDLCSTYSSLASRGCRLAFPAVDGEQLRFYYAPDVESGWASGPWGLREPDPRTAVEVDLRQVMGVFVPALAFDRRGVRLGRGKGYYDRALQNFKGIKVGVAFSAQIAHELPVDSHDVRMDVLVTEDGVLELRDRAAASGTPTTSAFKTVLERKGS